MSERMVLLIDVDNVVGVDGVQNFSTGDYLNTADVKATLKDESTDNTIAGQSWPSTMSYVAASNGDYRLTLSRDLILTQLQLLTLEIVVDDGPGLYREMQIPLIADIDSGP